MNKKNNQVRNNNRTKLTDEQKLEEGKKKAEEKQLKNVIESLEKIPMDTKQMIFDMAAGMTEQEIIQSFNQQSLDMFQTLIEITTKLLLEKEYQFVGYKALFDTAVKTNAKLPLDKFTLLILEFAADIYAEKEDCFLKMSIPDKEVNVGNEFGLIRSEKFKKLWITLVDEDKSRLKNDIILLTAYAHTFLYKSLQITQLTN